MAQNITLNLENTVKYHDGQFPPNELDYVKLLNPLAKATDAIARFDQMLKGMHNSEILLAPLRSQEAVISSRMEGTISSIDDVLKFEADFEENDDLSKNPLSDAFETWLYSRALKQAQSLLKEGASINSWLIRGAHKELLKWGRGATETPGEFKTEQNYLVDRTRRNVLFEPINPTGLDSGLESLFKYMNEESEHQVLIRTAISHVEFEALHPFKDGNGRIGRMLITLYLWKTKVISEPHFYISGYLEDQKDRYLDTMRNVSKENDWTSWCLFFLEALEKQAITNLRIAEEISTLYGEMKTNFMEALHSRYHIQALDFVFANPVFKNNKFTGSSGIPRPVAANFTRRLVDANLLTILREPAGRRAGLYAFEPLLKLVRV
jgi:Fic family protein